MELTSFRKPLGPAQACVFNYIQEYMELNGGKAPLHSEIAKRFGFKSNNSTSKHLKALHEKGYLEVYPGITRGIRVVPWGIKK